MQAYSIGLKQYLDFLIYCDILEPDTIPILIPLSIVLIMLWLLIDNSMRIWASNGEEHSQGEVRPNPVTNTCL